MRKGLPIPRLGPWEMMFTTAVLMSSKVFISFPRQLIERDAQAAWLVVLLALGPAMLGLLLLAKVMADFPGQPFGTIVRSILPKPLGTTLLLVTWLVFMGLTGLNAREFGESAIVTTLPETNANFLMLILLAIVGYSLYLGLEPLPRVSALFALPIILGLLAVYGLATHAADPLNLTPILGMGPKALLLDGMLFSSAYIGIYFLVFFAPGLGDARQLRRTGLGALAAAGAIIAGAEATAVLVFGYPTAAEFTVPVLQAARTIFFGRFFQRIEAVFTFTWMVSGSITLTGAGWLVLQMASEILGVDDRRPLIPPLLALIYAIAILPRDFQTALRWDALARLTGVSVVLGLPVLLWLAWLPRRGKGRT